MFIMRSNWGFSEASITPEEQCCFPGSFLLCIIVHPFYSLGVCSRTLPTHRYMNPWLLDKQTGSGFPLVSTASMVRQICGYWSTLY